MITKHTLPLYLAIAGVLGIALTSGIYASQGQSSDHVVNGLPPIERCVNDDFNDGSQDRCWSETLDGQVFVIDQDDQVISTDLGDE